MISKNDKDKILECAKKYNVDTVILFGSSVKKDDARDIDIGIRGIRPELFFNFYGELIRDSSKPVDVVDLSDRNLFNQLVERRGVKIYG